MKVSGWGRYPILEAKVFTPRSEIELAERIQAGGLIARGNGRSYGDSAISRQNTVHMRYFNRLIAFDATSGQVEAEAGVLLADIISSFLPMGWFPAVTPGTKYASLGGMIAADVHGKNHHVDGSFSNFVDWIDLMDASGIVRRCSAQVNPELFQWTVGGMGLTGIILRVAFRLRAVETAWIRQTTLAAANIDEAINLLERSTEATYSVAWIDCLSRGDALGRSIVMSGEHAKRQDVTSSLRANGLEIGRRWQVSVPVMFPAGLLNAMTVRAFNAVYYRNRRRQTGCKLVGLDSFFYPLDAIFEWNRIYGRKGFVQYQCVLPLEHSKAGLREMLEAISRSGIGSFLAVLKRLGKQSGRFSFPMPGYTLALDFPASARALGLMNALDRIALAYGGRFYLAKDSRMSAETLRLSDKRSEEFAAMRAAANLRQVFSSVQSERLEL